MRTISEAAKHWRQLDQFHSLTDLKIAVSAHNEPQITAGLRSVCWKIFLLFKTLDRSTWPTRLHHARTAYDSLRSSYLRAIQHPDEFDSSVDPLSENDESPWVALRADETLRAEIFQDIERCMPDNVYFRQPATQNMMLDALFVWCKMHPDVGYRQGMHEILAPILWVVERDAVDMTGLDTTGMDDTLVDMVDSTYMEHDAFTLFSTVMQTAKTFYEPAEAASSNKDTPMLARSARIYERYLPRVDPGLSAHLVKLEIVPQIFLLRWIRLLFGREFPLDSVLNMWDALFAIDSTLELVDMISIAMLLRIRWQLVAADTNEAFTLLLRYPEPGAPAYAFIKDALYLRDHLTPEGGANIITRYGQQAPPIEATKTPEIRASSPSPTFVSSRMRHTVGSPRAFGEQQSGGLESLLQNAAKGVIDRGSQWGVGKAIRDAVGEVKKNVEAYQSGATSGQSTPRSGGREFRKPARITTGPGRPSLERTQSGNVIKEIEGMERRNKSLANMLESAVGELWDYHKQRSEVAKDNKDAIEALSLAIAKVQFVQVYLEDSSVPLPLDETTATETADLASPAPPERTLSAPPQTSSSSSTAPLPSSSSQPSSSRPPPSVALSGINKSRNVPSPNVEPASPPPKHLHPLAAASSSKSASALSPRTTGARPLLSSPSFSWMLGNQETEAEPPRATFAKASEHSAFASDEKRRMRGSGKGFLFGDDEGAMSPLEARRSSVASGTAGKARIKKAGKKGMVKEEMDGDEEVIDLEDVDFSKRGAV